MNAAEDEPAPHDDDPVVAAAATWVARLNSADATDEDRSAFTRWYEADPAHAAAYDDLHELWSRMGEIPDPRRRRRTPPGGLAAIVAVLALGFVVYRSGLIDHWRADLSAPVGRVEAATLADGSRVWLNSGAALALRFTSAERGIELLSGEAAFDVTPDATRPFVVRGGNIAVRVVGTRFFVRVDDAAEPVGVSQGRVEVRRGGTELVLGPGDAARQGSDGRLVAAQDDIERRLAWRDGRLIYSGQPLADVLADIERYRRGRILLLDRSAGAMRVSATLDAQDPDAALDALTQTLGLRLTRITPFLVVIRRAS